MKSSGNTLIIEDIKENDVDVYTCIIKSLIGTTRASSKFKVIDRRKYFFLFYLRDNIRIHLVTLNRNSCELGGWVEGGGTSFLTSLPLCGIGERLDAWVGGKVNIMITNKMLIY